MMGKGVWGRGALVALTFAAGVAHADVRQGYDAWQRGDFTTAVGTWRPLAIGGDSDAQFNMGQAYKLGRGVPVDLTQAAAWFRKAADQGHVAARDNLGLVLFQSGQRAAAMPFIEEAAGHGDPRAQYVYATALFNGDMVKQDRVRAYALMTRASAAGTSAASASLAQMDRAMPADERARGLALARAFETHAATTVPAERDRPIVGREEVSASSNALPTQAGATSKVPATASATPTAKPAMPVAKPVRAAPASVAAAKPPPAPTPSGRWKVQLAALSDMDRANSLWTGLHGRIAALAPYRPMIVQAGRIVRVQAGPLASRADADRLCRAVRAAKQSCLIVAP